MRVFFSAPKQRSITISPLYPQVASSRLIVSSLVSTTHLPSYLSGFLDRPAVDSHFSSFGDSEIALEPFGCQQINGPLCGSLGFLMTDKLLLEEPDRFGSPLSLPLGFQGIVIVSGTFLTLMNYYAVAGKKCGMDSGCL